MPRCALPPIEIVKSLSFKMHFALAKFESPPPLREIGDSSSSARNTEPPCLSGAAPAGARPCSVMRLLLLAALQPALVPAKGPKTILSVIIGVLRSVLPCPVPQRSRLSAERAEGARRRRRHGLVRLAAAQPHLADADARPVGEGGHPARAPLRL